MKNKGFTTSANSLTQNVVSSFSSRLKETLGDNLLKLILFGSRARGDNSKYSDFDFVVVLEQKDPKTIDAIRSIEVEMMDSYDVLVSALIFSAGGWQKRQTLPIGLNIQREGIAVR
jgi:uncharacterized protein